MIVRVSRLARHDLERVRDWIARDNPERANSYVEELIDACEGLAEFPNRFPLARFRSRRPIRQRPYGNYLILYEVAADHVEIVGVVHGARDLDALFR
jgi:toxin ParE1/3/4